MVPGVQHTEKTGEDTLKAVGAMLANASEWHVLLPGTRFRWLMCVDVVGVDIGL